MIYECLSSETPLEPFNLQVTDQATRTISALRDTHSAAALTANCCPLALRRAELQNGTVWKAEGFALGS